MNFPTPQLNGIFDSSKPINGILSIWGDFGVGKTTFALQIAMNSAKLGEVVYIYSKPNFPYEKVGKILSDNPSNILNNITFISSLNFTDLNSIVLKLEFLILDYLNENKTPMDLIIIDSITDLYRLELNRDKKEKNVLLNYQLNQMLASLYHINENYGTEVLIVNELSRKNYDDYTKEVQSGGKVMDYWVRNSIKISRTKKLNIRMFEITKHPEMKTFQFLSDLTEHGFE